MANELKRHKKSDKIKWIATGLAVILLAAACATTLAMGVKHNGWFSKDETETEQPNEGNSGLVLPSETNGNGIKLLSAKIAPAAYAENGIDPQAESAFTLTATVTDSTGGTPEAIQKVTYSIAWKSGNPGTLSDFVTMTTSGTTATFTCKKAFSTQIIVTCTSDLDSTKSATATLDYYKRITSMKGSIGNTTSFANGTVATETGMDSYEAWDELYLDLVHDGTSDFNFGTGTINSSISSVRYTISLTSGFQANLKAMINALGGSKSGITFKELTGTGGYNQSTGNNGSGIGSMNAVIDRMITTSGFSNMQGYFYYFNNAIAATTNQLSVEMEITTSYGTETIQYLINFTGATTIAIGNVTTDKSGFIF